MIDGRWRRNRDAEQPRGGVGVGKLQHAPVHMRRADGIDPVAGVRGVDKISGA